MKIEVLDHGFVELIEIMGSDKSIEQAARCSYTGGEAEEGRTPAQAEGLPPSSALLAETKNILKISIV